MRAKSELLYGLLQVKPLSSFPRTLTRLSFFAFSSSAADKTLIPIDPVQSFPLTTPQLLRQFGCNDSDITKLVRRQKSLPSPTILQSNLQILQQIALTGSDLVKIITCRPRLLCSRLAKDLDHRLDFLETLLGSKELLLKALVRNPSLLTYSIESHVKPCIQLYQDLGIGQLEFRRLLISRPTIIPRSSLNSKKLEYIRRTGLSSECKMYKYVVSLVAISRIETIQEKFANLEKFGLSSDEVIGLFARSPLMITLSVDKVQRNVTYVIGTMRLHASIIINYPFLLYVNLEAVLKPRYLLAKKIRAMGLSPQILGPLLLRALRMKDSRFLRAFINCHEKDVANELMKFYMNAKEIKRLAQDCKVVMRTGFPF